MPADDNHLILLENKSSQPSICRAGRVFSLTAALAVSEHTRWVLWIPVLIGLGIGLYFNLSFEPPLIIGALGTVTSILLIYVFRRLAIAFHVSLIVFSIFLGFFAAQIRTIGVETTMLAREIGPTSVVGRVVQVEQKTNGARLSLESVSIVGLDPFATPKRVRVTARYAADQVVMPGDWISIRAVLRPTATPSAPGAFDFQRHAYFQGIGATGYSFGPPTINQHWQDGTTSERFEFKLARLRLSIGDKIRKNLPGETGALAAALITGERQAIPEQAVVAMRNAGLAHLLAISGLHIGLVAGLVFFVVRAGLALLPHIALHYPIKMWAAVAALTVAFFYALLAGSTIPTVRSFLMMMMVLSAVMLGRHAISMRSVALAATIVMLFNPESLLGPSFQLSFAAVIALISVYEWISDHTPAYWGRGSRIRRAVAYIGGVALSTLVAGIATSPYAAFHFHQLANYGMIANLVAIPLTALCIMPAALTAVVLMPFGVESLPLSVMGTGVEALLATARAVSSLPGNIQSFPAIPMSALVAMSLGGLWLCLWHRWWRIAGALGIVGGLIISWMSETPIVLASENAEIFAVQANGEMIIIGPGTRGNRYTRTAWMERAGYSPSEATVKKRSERDAVTDVSSVTDIMRCDHMGCIVGYGNGKKISVVWDEGALIEDCWEVEIIVSAVPVRRRCDAPQVIDRFDLWRNGAYAIYSDGDGFRIENSRTFRGDRPWTQVKQRSRPDKEHTGS